VIVCEPVPVTGTVKLWSGRTGSADGAGLAVGAREAVGAGLAEGAGAAFTGFTGVTRSW
jgi:hypothetical protein